MCWQRCRRCKSHSQICLCFPAWLFPPFTFLLLLCHRNINNGALFPKFWSLSVTSSIVMNRFQMLNFTYNLYCSEVTYIFHHWPRVAISKHCAYFLLRLKWATMREYFSTALIKRRVTSSNVSKFAFMQNCNPHVYSDTPPIKF